MWRVDPPSSREQASDVVGHLLGNVAKIVVLGLGLGTLLGLAVGHHDSKTGLQVLRVLLDNELAVLCKRLERAVGRGSGLLGRLVGCSGGARKESRGLSCVHGEEGVCENKDKFACLACEGKEESTYTARGTTTADKGR